MSVSALALLALLADGPSYPIGPLAPPSFTTPGHPFTLTDFHYRVSDDTNTTSQDFGVRARIGNWAFLSGEIDGQTKRIDLQTQRLALGYSRDGDAYQLRGGYRAPRFLLSATANHRAGDLGWVLSGDGALRLSPDLEILAGVQSDTERNNPRLRARVLRSLSLGFLYQGGSTLEVSGEASQAQVRDDAGFDLNRDLLNVMGTAIVLGTEIDAGGGYERTTGRFPHDEAFETLGLVVPAGHLLGQLNFDNTWEPGVGHFEQAFRAALTFTGRKVRLGRAGEAARLTTALARRASQLGYNERRAHDPDGRRELRERLALSPRRQEFEADSAALYAAQVAERNVLQAGLEYRSGFNVVRASSFRTYRGFVAVPWPLAWPFRSHESFVSFLKLSYIRSEQHYEFPFRSTSHEVDLQVDLNREQSLFLRWSKPGQTPIEVVRQTARQRNLELEYVYAFGK